MNFLCGLAHPFSLTDLKTIWKIPEDQLRKRKSQEEEEEAIEEKPKRKSKKKKEKPKTSLYE